MNETTDPNWGAGDGLPSEIYYRLHAWGEPVARRMGVREEHVLSVLHDAILSLIQQYPVNHACFEAYFRIRFRCRCWSSYRRAKSREEHDEAVVEELQSEPYTHPSDPWEHEPSEEMQRALNLLDPLDRRILTLLYWEDLSIQAIAALLGLSVNNVKSRACRARCRLHLILTGTPRRSRKSQQPPSPAMRIYRQQGG